MLQDYHQAIVSAQYGRLLQRSDDEHWGNLHFDRERARIYVTIDVVKPAAHRYVCRIDMSGYPVDPYWVGFIDPSTPRDRWEQASDLDARYWPWSPMPGLHGSFIVTFLGPYRTFWCRECNFPYFVYHGDQRWIPAKWPLDRVVSHLREALQQAEPPNRWRPLQQATLLGAAAQAGIAIPPDAGLGAK